MTSKTIYFYFVGHSTISLTPSGVLMPAVYFELPPPRSTWVHVQLDEKLFESSDALRAIGHMCFFLGRNWKAWIAC
jgi:hypothetical protein